MNNKHGSYYPNHGKSKRKQDNSQFVFRSSLDGFVGFFGNPSKIVDFANKKYSISCRKEQTSKLTYIVKNVITNSIVGYIFPIKSLKRIYSK